MAAAGAAVAAQGFLTPGGSSQAGAGAAGLDVIKAKLEALKQQINVKTRKMSAEKQAKIQGQIDKLEKSLKYVELQRVSACAAMAVIDR
jgi:capsule polysaccharide export protein KpsE/RkpR